MSPQTPVPQVFAQPPGGRFAVGCSAVLLALPVIAAVATLWANFGPEWAAIPIAVWLALAGAAYALFNVEERVTLDERGMRFSHTRLVFGVRLSERIEWDIPLAQLTKAREVKTRSPARNGGWNQKTVLQLPEGRTLDARLLGGDDSSDTAYWRLVAALKRHLGEAFEQLVDY